MAKRKANIITDRCVACGCCLKVCPTKATGIFKGIYAIIEKTRCVGCARCSIQCPANAITMEDMNE